jgi:hypothetical protein
MWRHAIVATSHQDDRMGHLANHELSLPQTGQGGAHTGTTFNDEPFIAPVLPRAGMLMGARYRLQKLLGRGGHGIVFRAEDVRTGRDVALKLLLHQHEDAAGARRFAREAEILGRLKSQHTVRVLDTGKSADGTLFLVMERVAGYSLEAVLRQRLDAGEVLNEADTTAIALQVLESLAEAHLLGLVHRDVKPSNIMLNELDGQLHAKVLDFGIAWTEDSSLTASGRVMGTPTYMSPEQCLGVDVDGRSDLYALAAVLYRCVAGRVPFDDPNALTVMYNHVNVAPRDLATVAQTALSDGFIDVVMRALAKSPDERFRDATTMRRALDLVAKGTPGRSVRSVAQLTASHVRLAPVTQESHGPLQRVVGRTRRVWAAALATAVVGSGIGAAKLWPTKPPPPQPAPQLADTTYGQKTPQPAHAPATMATVPVPKAAPVTTSPLAEPAQPPLAPPSPGMVTASAIAPQSGRAHAVRRHRRLRTVGRDDLATVVPPD